MHARIMLATTRSEMNKKSVEIVTEHCPRLPGKRVYKNRRAFSCIPIELTYISVETYNHFESNAASATDKENDMRHIPLGSSKDCNSQ